MFIYLVFRPMCHFVFLLFCVSGLLSFGEIKIFIAVVSVECVRAALVTPGSEVSIVSVALQGVSK